MQVLVQLVDLPALNRRVRQMQAERRESILEIDEYKQQALQQIDSAGQDALAAVQAAQRSHH